MKPQHIVGLIALGIIAAGYVALELTGHENEEFTSTMLMLLGVLGLGAYQGAANSDLARKADRVIEQTNGMLDARIARHSDRVMREVMLEAGLNVEPHDPATFDPPAGK